MCSVREVCKMLKSVDKIFLGWNGTLAEFDTDDIIQMEAYGDYAVREIEIHSEDQVGIVIASAPIKVN